MQKDTKNKETVRQINHEQASENESAVHVKRTYKSKLFEMIFS